MAGAFDRRLDAPHVRVIVVDADSVRLDSVQIVSVFRKLFIFKCYLCRSLSGVLLGVGNGYSDAVAVVHDLVFSDYKV